MKTPFNLLSSTPSENISARHSFVFKFLQVPMLAAISRVESLSPEYCRPSCSEIAFAASAYSAISSTLLFVRAVQKGVVRSAIVRLGLLLTLLQQAFAVGPYTCASAVLLPGTASDPPYASTGVCLDGCTANKIAVRREDLNCLT